MHVSSNAPFRCQSITFSQNVSSPRCRYRGNTTLPRGLHSYPDNGIGGSSTSIKGRSKLQKSSSALPDHFFPTSRPDHLSCTARSQTKPPSTMALRAATSCNALGNSKRACARSGAHTCNPCSRSLVPLMFAAVPSHLLPVVPAQVIHTCTTTDLACR
jgi:hypothetical protein